MSQSLLVLRVRNERDHRIFQLAAQRFPILIGRDPAVATCILEDDPRVSRIHASVDLRDNRLFVRDVESANGTIANGQRLGLGWTSLGAEGLPCELLIGDWNITVHVETSSGPPTEEFPVTDELHYMDFQSLDATAAPTRVEEARTMHEDIYAPDVSARLSALFIRYEETALELYTQISTLLGSLPPEARPRACDWLERTLPGLAQNNRGFARLFEHHRDGLEPMPKHAPERVALECVRYLARSYLGREPTTAEEIAAFFGKIHAVVGEVLHGLTPLLASLEQFEQQLALGDNRFRLPRIPAALARALLDWENPTDRAARALGRSFADVMMHHVGLLHGVMRGVKVLLAELSPDAIQRAWHERQARRAPVTRRLATLRQAQELLDLYAKRHSDLSDEENETFRLLFGREFAAEYKQFKYEDIAPSGSSSKSSKAGKTGARDNGEFGEGVPATRRR